MATVVLDFNSFSCACLIYSIKPNSENNMSFYLLSNSFARITLVRIILYFLVNICFFQFQNVIL